MVMGGHHQWNVNSDDGSITYAECPDLQLSSAEDSLGTLESFYFSLMNPSTGMVMGVDGEDCITEGTNIFIQKAVIGSPNQKFYMDTGSNEIVSLMCPNLVVTISDAS